jgi:F0F1-type ATP synthase assembly protein I
MVSHENQGSRSPRSVPGPQDGPKGPPPGWVRYGRGLSLVFEFTGSVGAGVFIGYFLDQTLGTEPWFLIILTLAAVVGGFVRLVTVARKFEKTRE